MLHDLRAALPLDRSPSPLDDEGSWAASFRFEFDVPELREHLGRGPPPSAPPLSRVIEALLGITTDYVSLVSARRDELAVHPGFERTFELWDRCGHVERVGDKATWTAKIAPHMQATHAWTEDGISEEERHQAEMEEMRRTMPPKIRKTLFSGGTVDVISLGIVISRSWHDGKWQDTDPDRGRSEMTIRDDAGGKAKDPARSDGFRLPSGGVSWR